VFGEGKSWGGTPGLVTRVLFVLAAEGQLVRGRPRGSWMSSQYRWAPMSAWIGDRAHSVDKATAAAELVRRYVFTFGPVTIADIKWWTGWTAGAVKRALESIDTVEVDTSSGPALVLAGDDAPVTIAGHWASLLPSLDPTSMGWSGRDWYVGAHREALFDRSGNIGPTVWCDGRIVGAWAQRADRTVAYRLLEKVGRAQQAAIEREQRRLTELLVDVRVTPRFRTPVERELAAG
jgi:hypothetical protein